MQALVKAEAAVGLSLENVPVPEIGINDVLIRVHKTGHLRHRPAHLRLGRVGAADDPGADGDRARVRRRDRRASARTSAASRSATSSAARATSSAGAAATAWPGGVISARTRSASACKRPGAFAELVALPMTNVWHHEAGSRRGRRRDLRPLRQRRAHGAGLPGARRGRAHHRRRPDRLHGGGRRAPRRRAPRRHQRLEPLPPRPGAPDGRDGGGRPDGARPCRRAARARHDRGLRRRPRDVRQPGGPARR